MTVKELFESTDDVYMCDVYEDKNGEYLCTTKTKGKGISPYLNRVILNYELVPVLSDCSCGLKIYLEAEKC